MPNTPLSGLSAGGAFADTDKLYVVETDGIGGVRKTLTQLAEWSQDLMNSTIVGGTNISAVYNDTAGTITLNFTGTIPASTTDLPEGTNLYFTDERAQDAIGAMVDASLIYNDVTPALSRAALTGDVTAAQGSNATTIANDAVTFAKMQNLSANTVIGSVAGGDPEEITVTSAGRALLDDADVAAQRATLGLRRVLAADITYHVATTGSDSNDGLSAGSPFLTIQKAVDTIATLVDLSGFNAIISVAAGTYAGQIAPKSTVGDGRVIIRGASLDLTSTLISTTATCFDGSTGFLGKYKLEYLKLQTTSGSCISALGQGIIFYGNVTFGAATGSQIEAGMSVFIVCEEDYTISAGGFFHLGAFDNGQIRVQGRTVTLTGTPAFTDFAAASRVGTILSNGTTWSGAATGVRYVVDLNAVILTLGGATHFPGDSAGTTATGGQYA